MINNFFVFSLQSYEYEFSNCKLTTHLSADHCQWWGGGGSSCAQDTNFILKQIKTTVVMIWVLII